MNRQSGFTLIEILISAGLMGFMATILIMMTVNQGRHISTLSQRLDINDIKSQLMQTFANPEVCSCHLNESLSVDKPTKERPLYFDSLVLDGTQKIELTRVRGGCDADAPTLIKLGKSTQSNVTITSIRMAQLKPTRVEDEWVGQWEVAFKADGMNLKPVSVFQRLRIDTSNVSQTRVKRCVGQAEAAAGLGVPDFDSGWVYLPFMGVPLTDLAGRLSPDFAKWTEHEPIPFPPIRAALMRFQNFDSKNTLRGNPEEWRIQYMRRTIDVNRLTKIEAMRGGPYEQLLKKISEALYPQVPDRWLTTLEDLPVVAGSGWLPGRVTADGIRLAVVNPGPTADRVRVRIWAPKN